MSIDNSFVTDIKIRKSFKELDKRKIVTDEYTNSEYPHLTFKIKNVAEYLEIVNILSQVKAEDFVNYLLFIEEWQTKTGNSYPL